MIGIEIRDRQDENEHKAITITDEYTAKYPEKSYMRYSFLWAAFNTLNNSEFRVRKREYKKFIFANNISVNKRYFINWGIDNKKILNQFERAGYSAIKIKLTQRAFGLMIKNTIYYPMHRGRYKSSNNQDASIEENFNSIEENMKYDEVHLRNSFRTLMEGKRPEFIIVNEDRTKYVRLLIETAGALGIKVFTVQHGLTPIVMDNHIPFANESFAPLNGDYICCWGENSKKYLIDNNVPQEKIIITGNADADIHVKQTESAYRRILVIDQQYIGQDEEMIYTYNKLLKCLDSNEIDYYIYMRGQYNYDYLKNVCKPGSLIKWQKGMIHHYMNLADKVVGFYSTAVLESLLSGTDAVSFDALQRGDVMGFKESGIPVVSDCRELADILASGPLKKTYLDNHFSQISDYAAKNIFDAVMERI